MTTTDPVEGTPSGAYDFTAPAHPTPEQMRRTLPAARDEVLGRAMPDPDDPRAATIRGLRLLADFLAEHPAVPLPFIGLFSTLNHAAIAEWVEGLDELDIQPGTIDSYRCLRREFAGLVVDATVRAEDIGDVHEAEVVETVTKLVPLTPTELIARAQRDLPTTEAEVREDLADRAYEAQEAAL